MSDFLRRANKPAFSLIPDSLWTYHSLSVYARLVYLYLCYRADYAARTAFPSYRTMSRDLECSRVRIIGAVKELIAAGLLQKSSRFSSKGDFTSNLYTLLDPDDAHTTSSSVPQAPLNLGGGGTPHVPPSTPGEPPLVHQVNHPPQPETPETPTAQRLAGAVAEPNKIHFSNDIKTTTTAPAHALGDPPSAEPAPTSQDVVVSSATPQPTSAEPAPIPETLAPLVSLVGDKLARKWLHVYGEDRLHDVLRWSATEAHTNPAGYIRKALEEAWPEPAAITAQRVQAERQAQRQAQQEAAQEQQDQAERDREQEIARIDAAIRALPEDARRALMQQAIAYCQQMLHRTPDGLVGQMLVQGQMRRIFQEQYAACAV